jgi:hypothetical protein
MNHYKLTETTYIKGAVRQPGEVVSFNDNPSRGGMRPGKTMIPCEADGSERQAVGRQQKEVLPADVGDIG